MIITCPSCSARYPVDAASFAPSGRKVRCAKCGNTWHQAPPSDLGRETGNDDDAVASVAAAPKETVAPVRPAPAGQKPLFNSGDAKAKSAGVGAADVAEKPSKPVPADPVDDDDIQFAPAPDQAGAGEDRKSGDTPIKFHEIASGSRDTGGTLRRYLNDVASMRRGRILGAIGWVLLVGFVAGSIYGVVHYRREIATFWPSTIRLYEAAGTKINLVGFELSQVSYERQDEEGLPVLAIKGVVENVSGETKQVPRVRVGLRDEHQVELYHWTFALEETELKPEAKASFVTRLSSPPAGARDLEVRFVEPDEEPDAAKVEAHDMPQSDSATDAAHDDEADDGEVQDDAGLHGDAAMEMNGDTSVPDPVAVSPDHHE